jgi:electron transport complex protein RnfG
MRRSEVYRAVNGRDETIGWAFTAEGPGFADRIELVVAVDEDFSNIAGFGVLASNETPGFGDRIKNGFFRNQFAGAPVGRLSLSRSGDAQKIDDEIIAITGATVSSQSVVEILNDFVAPVREKVLSEEAARYVR